MIKKISSSFEQAISSILDKYIQDQTNPTSPENLDKIQDKPLVVEDHKLQKLYEALSKSTYISLPIDQNYTFLSPYNIKLQEDKVIITLKESNNNYYYHPLQGLIEGCVNSILEFLVEKGHLVDNIPKVVLNEDVQEGFSVFNKTGFYDPSIFQITLFTEGRHVKDVLKTFTHEVVHHIQNIEGRLSNITTTNTNEDQDLNEIEQEAYLKGGIFFRMWEDNLKTLNEQESPCWSGYVMIGTKEKDDKKVPNCVPAA